MNKLFYYEYTEKINGTQTFSGYIKITPRYHYGEPDKIVNQVITDFNVLYNSDIKMLNAYRDQTLFKHRPVIKYQSIYCDFDSVSEKDFKEYSLTTEVVEVTYRISMEELMRELSAEEFVLWCKDHGMNVCPMNK